MAFFSRVPVVEVTRENVNTLFPAVAAAVDSSDFVAVDCELSGLGDRRALGCPCIEERFRNISRVAKTRAIIALGVSCFRLDRTDDVEDDKARRYLVQTFNVIVLCSEDYIVEPGPLKFLVEHGFDFQKQYSKGVPYYRGDDKESPQVQERRPNGHQQSQQQNPQRCHLRELFALLIRRQKPLVLHNGLVDLIFLYQNLYAQLPQTLGSFVADLTEMFPSGVYDTKYLAEYEARASASYLEFLFRKEQGTNREKAAANRPHVAVKFVDYPEESDFVQWRQCRMDDDRSNGQDALGQDDEDSASVVCDSYMHHGHCPQGNSCPNSHDIDLILQEKEGRGGKKAKRRKLKATGLKESFGGHRAGFDAFMTGFYFVTHLVHRTKMPTRLACGEVFTPESTKTVNEVNKIYLVSKDFPLLLQRSLFAKLSTGHYHKHKRLKLEEEEAKPELNGSLTTTEREIL